MRILLIEDSPDDALSLREMLCEVEGAALDLGLPAARHRDLSPLAKDPRRVACRVDVGGQHTGLRPARAPAAGLMGRLREGTRKRRGMDSDGRTWGGEYGC